MHRIPVVLACAACATACGADGAHDDPERSRSDAPEPTLTADAEEIVGAVPPADDGAVLRAAADLGFDPAHVELTPDYARIEGDMLFDRNGLVAGHYDYVAHQRNGLVEKGTWFGGQLLGGPSDIRLINLNVPSNLAAAVPWAGQMWGWASAGSVSMDIANNGSGGWIYVIVVNINDWSLTPCGSSSQACVSSFPQNGYPPYFVYMKSKPFSSCNWSLEAFAAVLIHELGHSLGLTHPNQGVHIAGTEPCVPGSDGICRAADPGYATVMSPTAFRFDGGLCRLVNPAMIFPQSDDFNSIQALYP